MRHEVVAGFPPALLKPVDDVRTPRHVADANALLKPEVTRGNAAIDTVSKPMVALAHGLDDRGGVDACAGLERIVSEDRVVAWEGHACVGVGFVHVFPKKRQVVVDGAHELEVDQRLVQGGVA